jgi:hypothetical protein
VFGRDFKAFFVLKVDWRGGSHSEVQLMKLGVGEPEVCLNAQTCAIGLVTLCRNLRITPGGGCYINEADYLEVDWQTAFFGSNYKKLLRIKQKYNSGNLFNCWKCVGWTGANE